MYKYKKYKEKKKNENIKKCLVLMNEYQIVPILFKSCI